MMKKDKQERHENLEKIFSKKTSDTNIKNNNDIECKDCDNNDCKSTQIMMDLSEAVELANQIGHNQLYNIFLTLYILLQQDPILREQGVLTIMKTCQEVYKNLNPKEMGMRLN